MSSPCSPPFPKLKKRLAQSSLRSMRERDSRTRNDKISGNIFTQSRAWKSLRLKKRMVKSPDRPFFYYTYVAYSSRTCRVSKTHVLLRVSTAPTAKAVSIKRSSPYKQPLKSMERRAEHHSLPNLRNPTRDTDCRVRQARQSPPPSPHRAR